MAKDTSLSAIGNAIGNGLIGIGSYSSKAAAQANGVSAAAQSAQGAFNQASANNANAINANTIANQYAYNSANMAAANDYNTMMWDKTASWNEAMWERQAAFNAEQAQIQRDWAERMDNTRYQRAIKDMSAAGLNPILAVTGGGIDTGGASGTAATVGGAQMSSAQSAMTSGGLLAANDASVGNYSGQMEYMGGMLGLISAVTSGLSSAMSALGGLGNFGEGLGKALGELFSNTEIGKTYNTVNEAANKFNNTVNQYTNYDPDSESGRRNWLSETWRDYQAKKAREKNPKNRYY